MNKTKLGPKRLEMYSTWTPRLSILALYICYLSMVIPRRFHILVFHIALTHAGLSQWLLCTAFILDFVSQLRAHLFRCGTFRQKLRGRTRNRPFLFFPSMYFCSFGWDSKTCMCVQKKTPCFAMFGWLLGHFHSNQSVDMQEKIESIIICRYQSCKLRFQSL